jgi:hypothetical protein
MRKVRIKPDAFRCKMCLDMAMSCNADPDCRNCYDVGLWIDTVSNFWGTYAIIQMDNGKIEKISLDRITVIEE